MDYIFFLAIEFTIIPAEAIFTQYENETLDIALLLRDDFHLTPITDATVIIEFRGHNYTAIPNVLLQYEAQINFTGPPGLHDAKVYVSGKNLQNHTGFLQLNITAKATTMLSFDDSIGSSVQSGSSQRLTVTLTELGGRPLGEVLVHFRVIGKRDNGSEIILLETDQITTFNGQCEILFEVPSITETQISQVAVEAEFDETTGYIGTHNSLTFTVQPSLQDLTVMMFSNPVNALGVGFSILLIGLGAVVTVRQRIKNAQIEEEIKHIRELGTLAHLILVYKQSGINIHYHHLTAKRIEPELMSGLLTAVSQMASSMTAGAPLRTLDYQGYKVFLNSAKYVTLILVMETDHMPSRWIEIEASEFLHQLESYYKKELPNWNGDCKQFDPKTIQDIFDIVLGYVKLRPHKPVNKVWMDTKSRVRPIVQKLLEKEQLTMLDFIDEYVSALGGDNVTDKHRKRLERKAYLLFKKWRESKLIIPLEPELD
ncbi:MAG: hypothetical protein ACTSYO_08235 [Candidatus Ranarchaeia archaeon]